MSNNRVNHDFQILYFLIGSKHTPDGAYSLLCDLKENREIALAQIEGNNIRTKVKILKAQKILNESIDELEKLEAQADIIDIENNKRFNERNVNAAQAELDFINMCIDKINIHRKFKHLSDEEAHEAAQLDEWKYELISRAENFLITSGSIPPDQFSTMRLHPAFESDILPAIESIKDNKALLVNKPSISNLITFENTHLN